MVAPAVSAWSKNNIREVKRTFGRFLAILAITALGVGIFSGLKITRSAMLKTADDYLANSRFYDYRLISTYGLTSDDAEYIASLDGVKAAEGSISLDITSMRDDIERVYRAYSITNQINLPYITSGRLPSNANECLGDADFFDESDIGSEIEIKDVGTDGVLKYKSYTITGLCNTPLYISFERGVSKLGSGSLDAFILIPEDGFDADYYTDIYVLLEGSEKAFTGGYDRSVASAKRTLQDALDLRSELRFAELTEEPRQQLYDAREEYIDSYNEYESKREETLTGLDDAKKQLNAAYAEISSGEDALDTARTTLNDSREEYNAKYDEYSAALNKFNAEYDAASAKLNEAEAAIAPARAYVDDLSARIANGDTIDVNAELATVADYLDSFADKTDDVASRALLKALAALLRTQGSIPSLSDTTMLAYALSQIDAILDQAEAEIANGRAEFDQAFAEPKAKLDQAAKELASAKSKIDSGEAQYKSGAATLRAARADYRSGLAEYEQKKAEAEEGFSKAEAQLAEAKQKIDDGQAELDATPKPVTYALDRSTNAGYSNFDGNSSIVEGIARVFPLFFFLVSALVCTTTMTRMVDEQRTQIGTFKALGFSDAIISVKYMAYSGCSAVSGCILGYFLGTWLFPSAIWTAYGMLYNFSDEITRVFDPWLLVISLAVSLICSVGATYLAVRGDLSLMPAELVRPKAPKAGKRILLERLPFIWNRVPFLHKVSIRNIMRYKRRLFMMILGVGGCTALIVTGFGVRDSIANIAVD